jgi:hypothetical protein
LFLKIYLGEMPMVEYAEKVRRLSLSKGAATMLAGLALVGAGGHSAPATEAPAHPLTTPTMVAQPAVVNAAETPPQIISSKPQKISHLTATIQYVPPILKRIGGCESGHWDPHSKIDYTAQNEHSSASGGFQITDQTWNGFKGYKHAKDAPKRIQIWKAKLLLHDSMGLLHWSESRICWD